jgi:formylglycine-generating enzyme required for sulfatase activity
MGPTGTVSGWVAGLAALITLIVVGALWVLFPASPVSDRLVAEQTLPESLPGFREDAWFLPDDDLLGFVDVPGGSFVMGSDPSEDPLAYPNERWSPTRAQGTVELPGFLIGRYEVTVAQFSRFVAEIGYAVDDQALLGPPDHPVSSVSWTDALAYARWLEQSLIASPNTPEQIASALRDGWRISLPTEAQWEVAARGADGRVYPWGNSPDPELANYENTGPRPVGSFDCQACPLGLADMSGNVWELTRSPNRAYPYDPGRSGNPEADALWIMRGGSFGDPARNVRAATRGAVAPGSRRPFIGFRVVIAPF